MVLWKKESNSVDAPFVDLFGDKSHTPSFIAWNRKLESAGWKNTFMKMQFEPGKNNRISDSHRSLGNIFFKENNWIHAMELYSQSLCFAELETNNVSFAYANRATCYLKLERYNECLRDIELAERAGYPHMPKLMQRKSICKRLMQGIEKRDDFESFELKLSFEPNERFPCMADALEIHMNEQFGRHVIANRDIDVGQTVLVEKCFISVGCAPDRVQCYNCTKDEANFIACPMCTDVMFCSEECRNQNVVHRKFCDSILNRMPNDIKCVATSLLLGIIEFRNAVEMMKFVEETLAQRDVHVPEAINDSRTNYGHFLSLKTKRTIDFDQVYRLFTGLLSDPTVKNIFTSEHSQRFLMHLCAAHWSIIKTNAFDIVVPGGVVSQKLGLVMSLFNHACAPNLFNVAKAGTEVFITTRPIKEGEQLFVSYQEDKSFTTLERQVKLQIGFNFSCKCDKCEPHCPETDRAKMMLDANYKSLALASNRKYKLADVKEKCVQFLQKFGHLPWSQEMDLVLNIYTEYLFDFTTKSR